MALIFEEKEKELLKEAFLKLKKEVNIKIFYSHSNSGLEELNALADDILQLSPLVSVRAFVIERSKEEAAKYDVNGAPCVLLLDADENFMGVKFYGFPLGMQINSFINAVMEVGGAGIDIPDEYRNIVEPPDKIIYIKVFVKLSCYHCVELVNKVQKLAFENHNIYVDIIDAGEFPRRAMHYKPEYVPTIVFNDTEVLVGNISIREIVEKIKSI